MWHRRPWFLRSYGLLPHAFINAAAARITRATRPRWLVDRAVRTWIRAEDIDLTDFPPRRYTSLEDFFLRELREGARSIGGGIVAPADGRLLAMGIIDRETILVVKEQRLSLDRLVNGGRYDIDLDGYVGGKYATIFLTPRGYHRVHAPASGELVDCRYIPGRYFPQNEDALRHIDRIYERNERATLRFVTEGGHSLIAVLVGASLIGGIELRHAARRDWVGRRPFPIGVRLAKGDELGHFTFGSTVVLLLPKGAAGHGVSAAGRDIRMGETLFALPERHATVTGP